MYTVRGMLVQWKTLFYSLFKPLLTSPLLITTHSPPPPPPHHAYPLPLKAHVKTGKSTSKLRDYKRILRYFLISKKLNFCHIKKNCYSRKRRNIRYKFYVFEQNRYQKLCSGDRVFKSHRGQTIQFFSFSVWSHLVYF